ncbi:MAG: iron complex transport system substrate-binding protein [Sphingomonadales bacterium]|jgi:iron complex transport system substrate-binding protein|nr:iron complex transport system substrate-binding protein [Sphingomonadales bacterium]MEA3046416.1 iron complex transport system substrate-binding protein [Sphingomonadales bacterium]
MRAFASLLAISLALAAARAEAAPRRVASLNLCTDELVLVLAAPEQIVTVTHLAQQEAETPLWRRAAPYPRNDGSLLSVVPLRPDLVVTMGGGGRDRLRIAERLGIRIIDLPFARSLHDVIRSISQIAAALGRPEAGAAVLRRMTALIRSAPPPARDAIWLGGGGRTVSAGGLEAQWMALAGLRQRPMQGDRVSLETLLVRPPAVLLRSDYRQGQYSNQQRWLAHPAARFARAGRTIPTDGRRWTCLGPLLIDEIYRLRGAAR